ncbi:MAG: Coenzyme F420 hydrogenase/dehydrogenase, beta subunit C-terminal domain [Methanobacterium sp.]
MKSFNTKNSISQENISSIAHDGLCTGCGICVAICPVSAIKMEIHSKKGIYIPIIDNKCNKCGRCYETCPGHGFDFKYFNKILFGENKYSNSFGNYINCYLGHSTNDNQRFNSSSGGLVTELLIFILENNIADGVLITKMNTKNPLEPEPFIARTKEEIIESIGSKYCPVPANIAIKEIMNSKNEDKFVVVGLPCHIQGIRKAELLNKKLKEKIVFHIGIFCAKTISFNGIEYFLKKEKIKKKDLNQISYRGCGWPGGMSIKLKDGKNRFYPLKNYYGRIFGAFMPWRCALCCDATAEVAEISCGDAWLPEYEHDKKGTSVIITRNHDADNLLKLMKDYNKCKIEPTSIRNVERSQDYFKWKKGNLSSRFLVSKLFLKKNPVYINCIQVKPLPHAKLDSFLAYILHFISIRQNIHSLLSLINYFYK